MAKPRIADTKPMGVTLESGTYYWCACGRSSNQPFCDGSHRGSEFRPIKFEITEEKKVFLCMCKQSENKPFCDGTHRTVSAEEH